MIRWLKRRRANKRLMRYLDSLPPSQRLLEALRLHKKELAETLKYGHR